MQDPIGEDMKLSFRQFVEKHPETREPRLVTVLEITQLVSTGVESLVARSQSFENKAEALRSLTKNDIYWTFFEDLEKKLQK